MARASMSCATRAVLLTIGLLVASSSGCGSSGSGGQGASCVEACAQTLDGCPATVEAQAAADHAGCGAEADPAECSARVELVRTAGLDACGSASSACGSCCDDAQTVDERDACVVPAEIPTVDGDFTPPDPRANDDLPFPTGPNGNGFTILDLPDGQLIMDPDDRGPAWAAGGCAEAVLACYSPPDRNLSGCFAVAPACESAEPWNDDDPLCCPVGCGAHYQALRRTGLEDPDAFLGAIYDDPTCIPGLIGRSTS